MIAGELERALKRQGIPVIWVEMGSADRATWRAHYAPEATAQQRADGNALLLTYDTSSDPSLADETATAATNTTIAKALCALMLDVKLNRRLTPADAPAVRAMFDQATVYYKFIVTNGL